MRRFVPVLLAAGLSIGASAPHGGWAAITLDALPDFIVTGTPVDLEFTVRQHGITLLDGLAPRIEARASRMRASGSARAAGKGRYMARVTVPEPGDWTITIRSGFADSDVELLPIRAIAAGGAKPAPLSSVARGRALFVAKGCLSCHAHEAVAGSGRFAVGPVLANNPLPADYIARFLADPSIRPQRADGMRMPNLELKPAEIASLVAFLRPEPAPTR